jgi:outer membrane immunogenic protein
MKKVNMLMGILAFVPATVNAQSNDEQPFNGPKIGVSVDRRSLDGSYDVPNVETPLKEDKAGIGYRGHVGYDLQIGETFVIGAEGGIAGGGRSLSAKSNIADYQLKPKWSYDVSGRVGVLPTSNILIYGRAGYSWLRTKETTDFNDVKRLDIESNGTKKGLLLGAGVETAVTSAVSARAEYNQVNYGEGLKSSRVQLGLSLGF